MASLRDLLASWNMPEEVIKNFEDEMFTERSLLTLDIKNLNQLIPWQGPRSEFTYNWQIFKDKSAFTKTNSQISNVHVVDDSVEMAMVNQLEPAKKKSRLDTGVNLLASNNADSTNSVSQSLGNIVLEENTTGILVNTGDATTQLYTVDMSSPYDLLEVLNQSTEGQCALNYYRNHSNSFDNQHRCKLAQALIEKELVNSSDKRITSERFKFLANQIVIKFPSESLFTWFDDTGDQSKGKLFTQYHSKRRKIRKSGGFGTDSSDKKTDKSLNLFDEQEDVSSLLLWLNSNPGPKQTVEQYWTKTHPKRLNTLHKEGSTILDYYKQYPALCSSTGYTLLEIDYDFLHPDTALKLYSNWSSLCQFLLQVALKQDDSNESLKKDLQEFDDLTEEEKSCVIFRILPTLFPVTTVVNKNRKSWRPSKLEMQASFLLHCKTVDDIKVKISVRRQKLSQWGLTLQPMAVLVGSTLKSISQCYVVVDDNFYAVESTVKAIDITFKCIQALNAEYPPESRQAWMFLQWGVYGFKTKFDKKATEAGTFVHEYEQFCKSLPPKLAEDTQDDMDSA